MKTFIKEFKEFALRGNMVEVAIGIMFGAAFKALIDSFISSFISPIVGVLFNTNLEGLTLTIGNVTFFYGIFLTTLLSFIATAFVLFLMIKAMSSTKKEAEAAPVEPNEDTLLLREIRDALKK